MVHDLIIYGAGYPDVIKLVSAINRTGKQWNILGFIDDLREKQGTTFMGFPVLGTKDYINKADKETYFVNNVCSTTSARRAVAVTLVTGKCKLAKLVHPSVDVSLSDIGIDTMISDGAIIGANAKVGNHCAIRYNSVVNHDCLLEDCVFIGPGATLAGHVTIKSGAYIGAGSVIKERIFIEENSIVGAGAAVVQDVPPNTTVKGVPAK